MNASFILSTRDHELMLALSQMVRLFSQRQIADEFWGGSLPNARRRLKQLESCELLMRLTVGARSIPEMTSPLLSWKPGDDTPHFGQLAYQCQSRWRTRPVRSCSVWLITERGAQQFGGVNRGGLSHPTQATHDLGVAAVWLRLREVAPEWATAWRGEDEMAASRHGEKRPDAFIVDTTGRVVWVLEFGGSYDAERIEAFHRDCVNRNLPYQLW